MIPGRKISRKGYPENYVIHKDAKTFEKLQDTLNIELVDYLKDLYLDWEYYLYRTEEHNFETLDYK